MAQEIKQGSLFGRIGTGVGKGLAEQLPKEVERGRLGYALNELGNKKDLTPFQQFTGLVKAAGEYPQVVESGANLLRQQGMLNSARDRPNPDQRAFESIKNSRQPPNETETKGLVGTENTQAALNPAVRKSLRQLQDRAGELNAQDPGLYPDYQTALQGAITEDQQRIGQNQDRQTARQSQKGVETGLRKELRELQSAANAKLPDNVYQGVEDEALDAIESGKKDELTAAKDARDKLDEISREYSSIDALGNNITLALSYPKQLANAINNIREKFKKRKDLENFADALVARNGLSNEYAHYKAMPPRPEISNIIKELPNIKGEISVVQGTGGFIGHTGPKRKDREEKSRDIIKKLAPMLNKDDSPLAIGYELSEKGYDSGLWISHLIANQEGLNLSKSQLRELSKVDKFGQGFLNDWWLKTFGGK